MNTFKGISDRIAAFLSAVAVLLVLAAAVLPHNGGDTESAARRCSRIVDSRMAVLESMVDRPGVSLPEDMVIYRYCQDSLQSWRNQFPVSNDAITKAVEVQKLVNPRAAMLSPLAGVGEKTEFFNFGPKWYLARKIVRDDAQYIAGLEIVSILNPSFYGTNPRLRLNDRLSVKPLSSSEGTEVLVRGEPLFKIVNESLTGNDSTDAAFIWAAFALFLSAAVIFLLSRRTFVRYLAAAAGIVLSTAAMYSWGLHAQNNLRIFSPLLYAGGQFLSSLGAVLLVNLAIVMLVMTLYAAREDIFRRISRPAAVALASALDLAAVAGIIIYVTVSIRSIVLDSNISLELYKFSDFSFYSLAVLLSFILLLVCVPLLLELLRPAASRFLGWHAEMLGVPSRLVFSMLIAVFLVVSGSVLGFRKEKTRLGMWANRLTMERDITLELQLRRVENQIMEDPIVSSLSNLDNTDGIIQSRIVENYLFNVVQDYDITVRTILNNEPLSGDLSFISRRIQNGTPIAEGSRFLYNEIPGSQAAYTGVFMFFNSSYGLSRVIVSIEPKSSVRCNGYSVLLGYTHPGRVSLPAEYSFARYIGRSIHNFSGNYPYPVELSDRLNHQIFEQGADYLVIDGHAHFINVIGDGEAVVISRPKQNVVNYVIASVCLALLAFFLLSLFAIRRRKMDEAVARNNHFRTRITWVLMVSLLLTLVTMATVSVVFVYRRNEDNLSKIMSDKINSVQALVQEGLRNYHGRVDFKSPEVLEMINTVSSNTSTDITLYSPDGLVMLSTTPEVFERMLLGIRINEDALDYILTQNKRYFIHREKLVGKHFYSMYAPLFGPGGKIAAILCAPYTEEHYDFEKDAVMHSMTVITLFLILLILARFMISAVVDRMFKPLSEMGRKMSNAGLDSLEQIRYDRDDEVSALVGSYNRMVVELSDSTRKLAQAERDKAWSGMARQVAHEIKNPLTPMKLQIQRIVRLKEKNAPNWQEKFDEATKILLDHIDILNDTANEFSTFAKLYSEEPTQMDLDKLLQDEIAMFDNRDDVSFDYIGLSGAEISGPKPQLTRVFVNLLGNAVQAVDGIEGARVVVALRNSTVDGCYDIVVEDNGPGVSEENVDKLFTPNFTTKSGGSGLGLAISRSILERCGASIRYSRSFVLGGACFTITYPKQTQSNN